MAPGAAAPFAEITWNDLEGESHAVQALSCFLDCNVPSVVHLSAADGLVALRPVPWIKKAVSWTREPVPWFPTLTQYEVWYTVDMPYLMFSIWTKEVHRLSPLSWICS